MEQEKQQQQVNVPQNVPVVPTSEEEILSIQYLLENPSLLQAPMSMGTEKSKEDKLSEPNVQDLPSAYLGPQIWNDMLLSDDLKLEPVDLDELFDGNAVNEADSDLGMFMASESSPSSINSSSPRNKTVISSMSDQQQQNPAGIMQRSDSYHQQQQQQQQRVQQQHDGSPPQYHNRSPNNNHHQQQHQQPHSPSDYLAMKQQQPPQQQQHYQNVIIAPNPSTSSQQEPPAHPLHTQLSGAPEQHHQQRRLSANQPPQQQPKQHRTSPVQQQMQQQQQQYPIFRSPYSNQSPNNNGNFMFDYTMPSPSSDYRRRSSPSSPSGSVGGYNSPQSRKRSHDSNCSDGAGGKFKVPSPDYHSPSESIASIRIPSPVKVNFVVNDADVLISTPRKISEEGEEETFFDPATRSFSQEELKPQPIIRKSRKTFVPPDNKDVKYWNRRKKNNVAAKRSREARRIKENQIALRASYLEQENVSLKSEIGDLRRELTRAVDLLRTYENAFPNFSNTNFVVATSTNTAVVQQKQGSPSANVAAATRYGDISPCSSNGGDM